MLITFHSVSLKNFLSYGNAPTTFLLERPGTTLIVGEDLDNTTNGYGTNGTGKSSIINAITYCLYDKPVSNISKDNLVNNVNKKNMEVVVEFTNNAGVKYLVKRTRKTKAGAAGNGVYLYENGKDITLDSVAATNAKIEEIIGVPYELFVRIVVFSASHIPFLDLPAKSHYSANQTDIIEELFGLTELSKKAAALKETIKETENKLTSQKTKLELLEKEHIRHQQQINSAKARVDDWNEKTAKTIKELRLQLKRIESVNFEEQKTFHETLRALNEEISEKLDEKTNIEKQIKQTSLSIKKNQHEISHLKDDRCPYCKQSYADAKHKMVECERDNEQLNQILETQLATLNNCDKSLEELIKRQKEISKKIEVDDIEELISIKNKSSQIASKIHDLLNATNPFIEPYQELLETKLEEINYEEVNSTTKLIEHQTFLLKLLTKKDSFVRKALLNKNIPYLNSRLQYYLTLLGLHHKVEFTHEMTAKISQLGKELDFGNLSAGQRARVNLALSLSFRDVLQSLHTKINICMFDEVLDVGLDAVGVQDAARLLKRISRDEKLSLFIISHRDEIEGVFDSKLTIQLSKGFSYIKENENE